MSNKNFIRLFIFYCAFIWFYTFAYSVLPTHLFAQGLSFRELVAGQLVRFAAQLVILPFLIYLTARVSWLLAMISTFLYVFLSIKLTSVTQFYIASIFNGFNVTLFYIFYNIAHFKNTPKGKTGFSSGLMFSMPVIIGIITPIIAGYLKTIFELSVWALSAIFFLLTVFLIKFPQDFKINFSLKTALAEIKPTRFYLFAEGFWEALVFGFIPIYTLFFLKTPLGYGVYLSYIAVVGAIAGIVLGRLTDKIKKRSIFLYPVSFFMAVVTIMFAFTTNNLILWLIVSGAIQFILPLFWNIITAFVVDVQQNIELAFVGREIMLASGKFTGLIFVYLSFLLEPRPFFLFFILAAAIASIGAKLYWETRIKKHHQFS
jgi:hypothetical protein